MMAKISSYDYGVSKDARVTIVRLPRSSYSPKDLQTGNIPPQVRHVTLHDALVRILADVTSNTNAGKWDRKAIINWSLDSSYETTLRSTDNPEDDPTHPLYGIFNTLQKLINVGVTFVTTAGNQGVAKTVSSAYPLWNELLPVIAVGAVDNQGFIWSSGPSSGTQFLSPTGWSFAVDIWAPGVLVSCLPAEYPVGIVSGTSICKTHRKICTLSQL